MKIAEAITNAKPKPFRTPEELIEKLSEKGVKFEKGYTREDAKKYLISNNNYYKLTSYRKNFFLNADEKYNDLDFEYLVNLAKVDMLFRYHVIRMTLDIEHFEKVRLLNFLKLKNDDGYFIVESFREHLRTKSEEKLNELEKEIDHNSTSIYCRDMINHIKPGQKMPVWVFVEVIAFGRFREFFEFCAKRYNDKSLIDESYRLKTIKSIRNAAGHSNCIINDLRLADSLETNSTNDLNKKTLNKFKQIFREYSQNTHEYEPDLIQNDRIKEIITLFYTHSRILPSDSMKTHYKHELTSFVSQMNSYTEDFRNSNIFVNNACTIIEKLVENWY